MADTAMPTTPQKGANQQHTKQIRLKLIVRKLPPTLSEEGFRNAIQAHLPKIDWLQFYEGAHLPTKVHARAYVHFANHKDLVKFHNEFNGHTFVDQRGLEHRAEIEYAPFQKIPKLDRPPRQSSKEGTIFQDTDYMAFAEALEKSKDSSVSVDVQLDQLRAMKEIDGSRVSLLVEDLLQRKTQKTRRSRPNAVPGAVKDRSNRPRQRAPKVKTETQSADPTPTQDQDKPQKKERVRRERPEKQIFTARGGQSQQEPQPSDAQQSRSRIEPAEPGTFTIAMRPKANVIISGPPPSTDTPLLPTPSNQHDQNRQRKRHSHNNSSRRDRGNRPHDPPAQPA